MPHARKAPARVSQKVKGTAAQIAALLLYQPYTKAQIQARLGGVSFPTIQRALEYLRDRGAWVEFSRLTGEWSLPRREREWETVTLGELAQAQLLPTEDKYLYQATIRSPMFRSRELAGASSVSQRAIGAARTHNALKHSLLR